MRQREVMKRQSSGCEQVCVHKCRIERSILHRVNRRAPVTLHHGQDCSLLESNRQGTPRQPCVRSHHSTFSKSSSSLFQVAPPHAPHRVPSAGAGPFPTHTGTSTPTLRTSPHARIKHRDPCNGTCTVPRTRLVSRRGGGDGNKSTAPELHICVVFFASPRPEKCGGTGASHKWTGPQLLHDGLLPTNLALP
jgi:hypothetical protein